jgi:hypothetical protein
MKKTLFGITIVTIILSCLLTGATAEDISHGVNNVIEKTYNVNPGGRLTVNADIGSIDIQTHTQDSVEIVITKKSKRPSNRRLQKVLADFKVTFDATPSEVSITGEFQRGKNYWRWHPLVNLWHIDIRFLVTVPQRYNVDLNTQSGNISTGGLTGAVQARTGEGTMRFNGITGPVSGKSDAGNITLANCQGTVDAKTSAGNIRAAVTTQPRHQWILQTSAGNITGTLNSNIGVEIDARTSVGNLSTDFMVRGNVTRSRLRGTINGGGPLLKLRTSAGNIRLLRN